MTEPTVRPARVADVPGIRRVAERGWRGAYAEILSDRVIDRAMAEWYDPEGLEGRIARETGTFLVAESDPVDESDSVVESAPIVGYASGDSGEGPVAELGAIYVDPERWGEGIGTALLSTFERECRKAGDRALRLWVLAGNEAGIAFYRARGYDRIGEGENDLLGERVVELAFERRLL